MSKYHNRKVTVNGEVFDSVKEANRFRELLLLLRAGEITELQRQVTFNLVPPQKGLDGNGQTRSERSIKYVADFTYKDRNGNTVVEDTKGVRTKEYVIKRKLMLFVRGICITEV